MQQENEEFKSTLKYTGENIFVKPICDFFGIEYDNQCRKIKGDRILQAASSMGTSKSIFNDERKRLALTKKGFVRWIQTINVQIVDEGLRDKLTDFQEYIFDELYTNLHSEEGIKALFLRKYEIEAEMKTLKSESAKVAKGIENYYKSKFLPPNSRKQLTEMSVA